MLEKMFNNIHVIDLYLLRILLLSLLSLSLRMIQFDQDTIKHSCVFRDFIFSQIYEINRYNIMSLFVSFSIRRKTATLFNFYK